MCKTNLFLCAAVFCVEVCVILAIEENKNSEIKSHIENKDHITADTAIGSELEGARLDECLSENGKCEYDIDSYRRKIRSVTGLSHWLLCPSGYKEYYNVCKECSCGFGGQCNFDHNGNKVCNCTEGFFEREGGCLLCKCMHDYDYKTECRVTRNIKRCFCPEGYRDVLGRCEDLDECEINNVCHPSTTCVNTDGSFYCKCQEGYKGNGDRDNYVKPGDACEDINECEQFGSICFIDATRCVNLPGSYKCECLPGYEPLELSVEPQKTYCVPAGKSWVPVVIVVLTTVAMIIVSALVYAQVNKRAAQSS